MTNARMRVKLFTLKIGTQWDDEGIGHVSCLCDDRLEDVYLIVHAEANGTLILRSKILQDTAYLKDRETLIVWAEGIDGDVALSFQQKADCDEIWEMICRVQGKDPSVNLTQEVVDESEIEFDITNYEFSRLNINGFRHFR